MVLNLLVGLPGDRPGGLLLSLIYFFASGAAALALGCAYAVLCVAFPRTSLPLQAATALLRGVPLILLVFLFAHVPWFVVGLAGLVALTLYSFGHVGEVLRSFLTAYPTAAAEQARLMGMSSIRDWLQLRMPWTLWRSWTALITHWVSLLKDTGALVILGIGELTTTAKVLSEVAANFEQWATTLVTAACLYLGATLALIQFVPFVAGKLFRILQQGQSTSSKAAERYA